MKRIIISLAALFGVAVCVAQSYGDFMQSIVSRSPQFRALGATLSADSLAARRGLNPADPSVELEYFFGKDPSVELVVTQEFDFPTVYHQRNKISEHSIEKAQAQYMASQKELMLESSQLYNTLIYYTQLKNLYAERTVHLDLMDSLSEVALSKGSVTSIEHAKIHVLSHSSHNEQIDVISKYDQTLALLEQLGSFVDVDHMSYPDFVFSGTSEDFVKAAMAGDWALESARIDSLIAGRSLKLARSEWAPGLKVGYKLGVESEVRHALVAGITIPLWQNRNNVKHSKALIAASSAVLRSTESQLRANLSNLYQSYASASKMVSNAKYYDMINYRRLMEEALEKGTVSVLEYLLDLVDAQQTEQQMVEAQYQRALIGGQMAIYLY